MIQFNISAHSFYCSSAIYYIFVVVYDIFIVLEFYLFVFILSNKIQQLKRCDWRKTQENYPLSSTFNNEAN